MRHGSHIDPPNRFLAVHAEDDFDHLEWDQEYLHGRTNRKIEYLVDTSRTIVAENNSPDIRFRYSINPYRGCAHGCSYCYARPFHEYLGYNAGLDFETKILVKHDAAKLFRGFLANRKWQPELIAFSGVTDCYQPAERTFRLTRSCLEVALEAKQPVGIVTKNALVVRDVDLLSQLAQKDLVHVCVSVTTLDANLARTMEPRTSAPAARLGAIKELSEAGVPTQVMVAPIIPGLTDSEMPAILEATADAGARAAAFVLLRLPLTVEPVFLEWLQRTQPERFEKVVSRIRHTRDGEMYRGRFRERQRGTGEIASQIAGMFKLFTRRYGLDQPLPPLNCNAFERPALDTDQLKLF